MWLFAHIALSFVGIAAFATAAAAGIDVPRSSDASSSRAASATLFRFFPPLATLDRVNHLAAIAGWLGLTLGVVLATTYSVAYHELNLPQIVWGSGAWLAVTLHRGRTRHARMAGAARGEVLERRVRRRARAVRRVPRRRTGGGAVPVSAYPLMLDGAALSALVVGGGRVATRKVRGAARRRCARARRRAGDRRRSSKRSRRRTTLLRLTRERYSPTSISATRMLVIAATNDADVERARSPATRARAGGS